MPDAETLAVLQAFARQHAAPNKHTISTEFREGGEPGTITVIKQCQECGARVETTMTRAAAARLLRQTGPQGRDAI